MFGAAAAAAAAAAAPAAAASAPAPAPAPAAVEVATVSVSIRQEIGKFLISIQDFVSQRSVNSQGFWKTLRKE